MMHMAKMHRGSILRAVTFAVISIFSISLVITLRIRHSVRNTPRPEIRGGQSVAAKSHIPVLNVDSITQHGHIVEIKGDTEPGTAVMVNGERAAVIFDGSRFHHFVGPLPDGVTLITVTVQDSEGGVNTKKLAVELP